MPSRLALGLTPLLFRLLPSNIQAQSRRLTMLRRAMPFLFYMLLAAGAHAQTVSTAG